MTAEAEKEAARQPSACPPPQPSPRSGGREHVLIVGGGLAGLAAAAALAARGVRATVLESRPALGGRTSSFVDAATGDVVDNCQHVGMGCCTNWLDFCERTGLRKLLREDRTLVFQTPDGRRSALRPAPLPAPLHLAPGFLRLGTLPWGDKVRIAAALARLALAPGIRPAETAGGWLRRRGQTPLALRNYWEPILVSALNDAPDRADAWAMRQVFVEGFLRERRGGTLFVPAVPLGELYGEPLQRWLADRGAAVRLNAAVESLELGADGTVSCCRLRNDRLAADAFILAVPWHRVTGLLPADLAARPEFAALEGLAAAPITSVHLWFDRPALDVPHLVPLGRTAQWLFRRDNGWYVQAVVSASEELAALGKDEIARRIEAEVREILPAARAAKLLRVRVVTERRATFAPRPGSAALRPGPATPIGNLFLAGDWTATGWPATMEGAVRSGYRAAEAVLASFGRREAIMRPGLRGNLLTRWLRANPPGVS